MAVHQFMLGRELPCTVLELLHIRQLPLSGAAHDALVGQVESGKAYPDVLYKLGVSHLGRQELGLARRRLEEAVQKKPDYIAARLALAGVCDLLAQHSDAVDQIDAVIAMEEPSKSSNNAVPKYALYCAVGFCLERCGNTGTAVFRYEQALKCEPNDLFARHRLAAIYLAHNQLDQAIEQHKAILDEDPQDQGTRTSLAHLLQLAGRHKEAVWEYEKALCLDPDNWDLQLELADQFQRMGNTDAAIRKLRSLCEKNPSFPDLRLRLANLYSSRGDDRDATAEYQNALDVHGDYLECHIAAARHELKMGRIEKASRHFQRAMDINNRNVEAYAGMALALHKMGKTDEARDMLTNAQKVGHNSDVLIAQLGDLELQVAAAESAEQAFDPRHQKINSNRPTNDAQQREWINDQIHRYELALAEHPGWSDVRVRYGMLLKLVGRWQDASEQFATAARENPGYVESWVQLALAKKELGDIPASMNALETAIQIKPEYADLHYKLGMMYCSEMEFELAMERMELAVSLSGKNPDFQRNIFLIIDQLQMSGRGKTGSSIAESENQEIGNSVKDTV